MTSLRSCRWLVSVFALVLFFWLVTVGAAIALAEGAIHPLLKRRPSDTAALAYSIAGTTGALVTQVQIKTADGVMLDAWWLVPVDAKAQGVIVCHGVADSAYGALGYALLFLRHGYSVLVPESRGHGQSRGFNTYGVLERNDIVQWVDWMSAHGDRNVAGFGESLGGSILLQALAAGAPLRTVIAECSYSSFPAIAEERVARFVPRPLAIMLVQEGIWYGRVRYGVNLSKASPVEALRSVRVPVLLIHGLADNETSPENTRILARVNPAVTQTWFVPRAGHTGAYAADPKLFESKVLEWLAR